MLRSLTLEGIRSYRDETQIPISTGVTLFEGDMASGKSTILYAIEFALFGLGSLKGTYLLSHKAKRGSATLVFEVDGKEYEVHRALERKGKAIQQVDCYVQGPEGKELLAATELKEKILQVLNFNEPPNARAQSVIYRYAVFTPQEEMKKVIEMDSDDRRDTLRRAFGIEQYKTAVHNSSVVASRIKEKMDLLHGASLDLEEVRQKLVDERKICSQLESSLGPLKKKEIELKKEAEAEKSELEKLEKAREKMKIAEGRVPLLESDLSGKVKQKTEAKEEAERFANRVTNELQPKISELRRIKRPTDKSRKEVKKEIQECRTKKQAAESLKSKVEERMANFDTILEKNTCPVCERKVEHKDFATKLRHLRTEGESLDKAIIEGDETIKRLEELEDSIQKYESAQTALESLVPQLDETNDKLEKDEKIVKELDPLITNLKKELQAAEEEIRPLESLLRRIDNQETTVAEAEAKYVEAGQEVAKTTEKIRGSNQNQARLDEQIHIKEQQRIRRDSLAEARIWLLEYMAPTIENIEAQVMSSYNQGFNQQFQKWFQLLMDGSGDLEVRVDEEFSPIIEREEYEQQYQALSGGERTSVALAYRLALNVTVQEATVKTGGNLLILDEPTDGFSKEQLSRVRDVLKELNCPQVILVSHETELESFADHIVKVENSNGTSTVRFQTN